MRYPIALSNHILLQCKITLLRYLARGFFISGEGMQLPDIKRGTTIQLQSIIAMSDSFSLLGDDILVHILTFLTPFQVTHLVAILSKKYVFC